MFLRRRSGMESKEYYTQLDNLIPLFRNQLAAGRKVKFSPSGISMLPMLRQGRDCVILSPVPEKLKRYDLPLYQRDDGKYILHRIVKTGETYTCMGDNQFVPEHGVRQDQMIAVVTAFTRDKKEYSTKWIPYRLYCCLWYRSRYLRRFWKRGNGWLRRNLR